jgi:hypothetical protein
MKNGKPVMVIAIGMGKKRRGKDMEEMDDMDDMEDDREEMMGGGMAYAKGGMTKGGRDGCAIRGKTKGRMV